MLENSRHRARGPSESRRSDLRELGRSGMGLGRPVAWLSWRSTATRSNQGRTSEGRTSPRRRSPVLSPSGRHRGA